MRYKIYLSLLIVVSKCYAPELTITEPGLYKLGQGIDYASGIGDTIISIQSSDVVLDLGGRTITQIGSNSADGITIGSGFDRITIQNGTISNVANRGIFVNTGTSSENIKILNITFDTCKQRGISFEGAQGSSNCTIKECVFINCDGLSAINFSNTSNTLEISDITLSQRIGSASLTSYSLLTFTVLTAGLIQNITLSDVTYAGFTICSGTNATGIAFKNILAQNITSTAAFTGININTIDGCIVSDMICQRSSSSGAFTGINCSSTCTGSLFNNCRYEAISSGGIYSGINLAAILIQRCSFIGYVSQSITSSSSASHISITGTSTQNLFIGCIAQAIAAAAASTTFNITSATTALLIDCIAQACSTSVGNFTAFNFNNGTSIQLIRCYSIENSASAASAVIIGFNFNAAASGCSLRDCIASLNLATGATSVAIGFSINNSNDFILEGNSAYRNNGTSSSTGFTRGAATNAFIKNIAVRNGTVAANQFSGFAGTQANTVALASVNSITQPFTNAGLV